MRRALIKRLPIFATLLFGASSPGGTDEPSVPITEVARPADAFVDTIGVNVHLGYNDTIYNRYDDVIRPRLAEVGIRHIRDGLQPDGKDVLTKLGDLATLGIHSDLIVQPTTAVTVAKAAKKSVETVEGPNEPDHGDAWEIKARADQQAIYEAIRRDPDTGHLPVLVSGMANTRDSPTKLGSMKDHLDFGNTHSYPGGLPLTSGGWGIRLEQAFAEARKVCDPKPLIATETGYHNRLEEKGHPGITEVAAAKYIPRLLLTYFDKGIVRTYLYEFADEKPDPDMRDLEQHCGMLRVDGTVKPSFEAVKNLIAILRDPGPTFESRKLSFALEGAAMDVRHVLLARRDGAFDLILWQEVPSYDIQTRQDIVVEPRSVMLWVGSPFESAVSFRPCLSTQPEDRFASGPEIGLRVPDEPLIIRIKLVPGSWSSAVSRRIDRKRPKQAAFPDNSVEPAHHTMVVSQGL